MYHQVLTVGEGHVPCVIEYTVEDGYCIVQSVTDTAAGLDITRYYEQDYIDALGERLDVGHEAAVREMDFSHGESVAAERAADREAFA